MSFDLGPIEFHEDVLEAMTVGATSHVDPEFIHIFGKPIEMVRKVVLSKNARPFIVAGSGTLGWDMVATNLVKSGENALVISNGYFGDKFGLCLQNYGANDTFLHSSTPGDHPSLEAIERELLLKQYKLITVTHVDTSTGVLSDIAGIGRLVHQKFPETLVVADGVCSVGCEEIKFNDFGLDIVLTGSQKALGARQVDRSLLLLTGLSKPSSVESPC
ncbi:PLP-dependent transferase [Basidiobolus meristosporus CBS 931.73]|uniref:PLP-dependent transferase n=1 Tax=Basidiobolus meristosporus CBS 931.73 TaxID=1314790 RepID=A0A1Y1YC54_9FUNG|nr:PLP-dependent transferase [Basidiobolus meristosporus CBS 931.73]|eukprot:ORX95557.1 PLP-dependent transferase [Basidiobolus meristosporus CBS 931.73]